jgi:NADH-quinone oxidoreductase subunit H
MGMALAAMVVATGSLKMTEMVRAQEGPLWGIPALSAIQNWFIFTPFGFVAFVIFVICMVAETNRAPFDLPEAENEIIAGYHTEYSSMKFAVFFMGEYAAMMIFSAVAAVIFLGGYNFLPLNWIELGNSLPALKGFFGFMDTINTALAPLWLLGKAAAGVTAYIWLRATLPRLRYDQLMNLGWKVLLPVGVANFLIAGFWVLGTEVWGLVGGWAAWALAAGAGVAVYLGVLAAYQPAFKAKYERRTVALVDPAGFAGKDARATGGETIEGVAT